NGAQAIGFGKEIGSLEIGKRADLVIIDYRRLSRPFLADSVSPLMALIYRAKAEHVTETMIEGRVVYRGGTFTYIDREQALERLACDLDRPDRADEASRAALSRRLLPKIEDFYRDWELPAAEPWYRLNGR